MAERLAANGSAVQVEDFLFGGRLASLGVPEVIATCLGLLEAVGQAPTLEAEYQYGGEQAEGELNSAADPVLRGICGSDLRRIRVAPVALVEVIVALVRSMFRSNRFCLICLSLSTTAETKLRQQLAAKKVDYPD